MKQVMCLGGDVDTNCCIVGGLVGAMIGVNNIDEHYLITCLESDHSLGHQDYRPDFLQPAKGCITKIIKLTNIAP